MKKIFRILCVMAAAFLCFAPSASQGGGKHSKAEVLLFETNHLKQITAPSTLYYTFKKEGTLEPGFEDSVEINIKPEGTGGTKWVSTRFLSGERQVGFPPVGRARGNPILLYFLDWDVREMQRLTQGNWRYFQSRIRLAFADEAEVRPVRFGFHGRQLRGTEIKIFPYAHDPKRSRYEKFAGKYYVFVLSPSLPGAVYQIRTVVPGSEGGPLLEETLTFSRVGPLAQKG